jgi:hypothetical protein
MDLRPLARQARSGSRIQALRRENLFVASPCRGNSDGEPIGHLTMSHPINASVKPPFAVISAASSAGDLMILKACAS